MREYESIVFAHELLSGKQILNEKLVKLDFITKDNADL